MVAIAIIAGAGTGIALVVGIALVWTCFDRIEENYNQEVVIGEMRDNDDW